MSRGIAPVTIFPVQARRQFSLHAHVSPIIDRVRVDWGTMPVNLVFSYGDVSEFTFTIVRLWSGEHCGMGEVLVPCSKPFVGLLSSLVGTDVRRLDSLLPANLFCPAPVDATTDHNRILCEAISMAMHDLLGHLTGLPLYVLLGGAKQKSVPLMPCIFPHNPQEARQGATKWSEHGHRFLKVKLVGDLAEDRARIEAVRSVWPRDRILQGDANCGYKTPDDAQRALAILGEAGLDIFEDPLEGGVDEYALLTRRRSEGDAKVMIDALSRRTSDLAASLRQGACDIVGIHPDQPGSLSHILQHAALASAFGVPVVVGGTGYTGVGSAAYQHLTGVIGGPCGELGGYFDHGMPHNMVRQALPTRDGCVELPDRPGMGTELDEEVLTRYRRGFREWRRRP